MKELKYINCQVDKTIAESCSTGSETVVNFGFIIPCPPLHFCREFFGRFDVVAETLDVQDKLFVA